MAAEEPTTEAEKIGHLKGASQEFLIRSQDFQKAPLTFELLDRLEGAGVISQDEKKRIWVAFNEAVTNAHEHGNLELLSAWRDEPGENGSDRFSEAKALRTDLPPFADRTIWVFGEFDGESLIVKIRDEGPGFVPGSSASSSHKDPAASHGRGLRLIRHFMDSVEFQEGGRMLEMRKRLISE
jgi:anti-sigma regulatory factor (Ser/Thr protein kinase)